MEITENLILLCMDYNCEDNTSSLRSQTSMFDDALNI